MSIQEITIKVIIIQPKRVTFKMVIGIFLAWLFSNAYYLLKYGWEMEIKEAQ